MKIFYILTYLVLLVVIFFYLPDSMVYGNGLSELIPYLLIFIVESFLLNKLLGSFKLGDNARFVAVPFFGLLLAVLFWLYTDSKENETLKKHGVATKAVIYEKFFASGNLQGWYIRGNYNIGDKNFLTPVEPDRYNKLKIGDTVTVIYNKNFPQQNLIVSLLR